MKRFCLLLVIFLLLIPIGAKASFYCDYNKKANLKKLASNLNVSYSSNINNNIANFDITISNIFDGLILRDVTNGNYYYGRNQNEVTITNFKDGGTYKFEVYTTEDKCEEDILYVFYASTPFYNSYYKDPLCSDISDYKLCQKWIAYRMDYNTFKKDILEYKNSLIKEEIPIEENIISNFLDFVLDIFVNYYIYILGSIIIVCSFIIYQNRKKDSFNI